MSVAAFSMEKGIWTPLSPERPRAPPRLGRDKKNPGRLPRIFEPQSVQQATFPVP